MPQACLNPDPRKRPQCEQLLHMPYFAAVKAWLPDYASVMAAKASPAVQASLSLSLICPGFTYLFASNLMLISFTFNVLLRDFWIKKVANIV